MSDAAHGHSEVGHVVSLPILAGTFVALLVLTVLTVAATWVDLGSMNVWLALLIAVAKGGLVAMYFMHLRWDHPFNGLILIASLLFVAIFLAIVILDTNQYMVELLPPASAGQ